VLVKMTSMTKASSAAVTGALLCMVTQLMVAFPRTMRYLCDDCSEICWCGCWCCQKTGGANTTHCRS
jgi:hypothetical protein